MKAPFKKKLFISWKTLFKEDIVQGRHCLRNAFLKKTSFKKDII